MKSILYNSEVKSNSCSLGYRVNGISPFLTIGLSPCKMPLVKFRSDFHLIARLIQQVASSLAEKEKGV